MGMLYEYVNDAIYDYVFHYNPHTCLWSAIPRERYTEYWNNADAEGVLKSKDVDVLVRILSKGEDFVASLSS